MREYIQLNDLAPIVVTTYNRKNHLKNMITSLKKNNLSKDSEIYIFCDNYKSEIDKNLVQETINYAKDIQGFKKVEVCIRETNIGMVDNTLSAVDFICNLYDKFIFLEDDAELSPIFLEFMNASLNFYKENDNVMCVTGWKYPCKPQLNNEKVIFTRLAESWTWATWKDRFVHYNRDNSIMKKFTKRMIYEFNFHNTNLFWRQLVGNKEKRVKTWSIYWYAASFLNDGLCVAPPQTLVKNTGNDGSGYHTEKNNLFDTSVSKAKYFIFNNDIKEDIEYFNNLKIYFKSMKPSIFHRVKFRLKNDFYTFIGK